jgi:hypothetical protein
MLLMTIALLSEDNKKSLASDKTEKKQKYFSCADDYISAILITENKGKINKCNKLIKKALKRYPEDYLLLYHAGRIIFNDNKLEGERLLIKSVYANPAFEETHLLLGEKMYYQNNYLKTILPLLYFLLLENDTESSVTVVLMIENLLQAWAHEKIPENHLNFSIECNFIPAQYTLTSKNRTLKYKWLVEQTLNMMQAMNTVKTYSSNVLWEFYTDFFRTVVETENANALAHHLFYSLYPADVLEWISENTLEYKQMIDWMTLQ